MSNHYDGGLGNDDELTPMQQQMEEDLEQEMAKQGVSYSDFPEGVPVGAFIDEKIYK